MKMEGFCFHRQGALSNSGRAAIFRRRLSHIFLEAFREILRIGKTYMEGNLGKIKRRPGNKLAGALHPHFSKKLRRRRPHKHTHTAIKSRAAHAYGVGHFLYFKVLIVDTILYKPQQRGKHVVVGCGEILGVNTMVGRCAGGICGYVREQIVCGDCVCVHDDVFYVCLKEEKFLLFGEESYAKVNKLFVIAKQ